MTAGPRGPALLQDVWLLEKLAPSLLIRVHRFQIRVKKRLFQFATAKFT
jgi:catalase